MDFKGFEYWDVTVDGIQIVLCLLIIVLIFRNRSRHKKSVLTAAEDKLGQNFNAQVFTQTIKQQVDQALANILETVEIERSRLDSILRYTRQSYEKIEISEFKLQSDHSKKREVSRTSESSNGSKERHARIKKLAAKGMNASQISEKTKAPVGEIELILSLQKDRGN